ncbi:glycogen debranching protein GlgX [Lichenihabitans sp. Uapishka_5]|uniref:glycogen debranching protein GlgX n=1 Tax=Lichenihabitans sp. Uapishka_5 TaxID=3037302 RepID=UPI0029E7F0D2|nr:glycogen debranching protein GlgX [Lichenihabitans sp. Uapishka_5]MDX7950965.1 glycogen debranching protein GlgX [Lichenihabitans sp. Uapishka_5]
MVSDQARVREGSPEPRGVSLQGRGVNVSVYSAHAEAVWFCVFDEAGEAEVERIRLPGRSGDVFHGLIDGIAAGARYGLRVEGPYDPGAGHRFNAAKLLLDPYALAVDRPFALAPEHFGFVSGENRPDDRDSAAVTPKAIVVDPVLAEPASSLPGWDRLVVAELHLRGATKLHPGVPEALRGTFAGLASPAMLDHLTELGVTAVELLPTAVGLDERHLAPLWLTNYWNYNPVGFMAPDPRLAPGGWDEVRRATASLNAAGLAVILDVVFNHSGESDAEGPTVAFRGLDNASYYRLAEHDRGQYVNDAGCGNILQADHPEVVRLVLDSLRAWARYGGINGFRFDLAPTLGRSRKGFDAAAPLLSAIVQDPVLRTLILIAEPWDIGPGGYQLGAFGAAWGEWNDRYRDDVRRFWRGDGTVAALATRLAGSADVFSAKSRPSRSINYVTSHDGFTLRDLVSYASKHNEANGEHNRDGTTDNLSWNNGVEGVSHDPAIEAARRRDMRVLLATLFVSRGTPMLGPGSDTGHSQDGNNNAYAQDNPVSWTDWGRADAELPGLIAALAALRAAHPALHRDRFLTGRDRDGIGLPDVSWHRPDGAPQEGNDWQSHDTLMAVLAAPWPEGPDAIDRVATVFHAGREPVQVTLPAPRPNRAWRLAFDSGMPVDERSDVLVGDAVAVAPRSVLVFAEEKLGAGPGGGRTVAPEVLDRLAATVGIAPEWTQISGEVHRVTADTKQALLAAMGLPARTTAEAEDGLHQVAAMRDRRVLPRASAVRDGAALTLRVAGEGFAGRSLALSIRRDDGSRERLVVKAEAEQARVEAGADGRPVTWFEVPLPPQPIGRHQVTLEEAPDQPCSLTVAPGRCTLPSDLRDGGSAFGIAAHLYSLRHAGDAGIGDFTTLGAFGARAARSGARILGINPIHAMFATNRDRASPYNPSDRRFLDPIYLDVGTPDILGGAPTVQAAFDRQAPTFATLSENRYVDYAKVWAGKRAVLEAAFAAFESRHDGEPGALDQTGFAAFLTRGGTALQRFATFEAIAETLPDKHWQIWPDALRQAGGKVVADFAAAHADRVRFHAYLQWLSDSQLGRAAATATAGGLSLGLYRDLAVGCAPDGAEAWANPLDYAHGVSVGAPPDPFSASGQVWSLPPPSPLGRYRTGGALFGELLEANMRHAGALRIDHAMGLSRLFWVPDGMPGSAGAYVANDFEANLADVALASHRAQCLVIGEDLGTVQEGFRERLADNDILAYRVLFFERDERGFTPAERYPRKAVACVATHDLAPLAGWWRSRDTDERLRTGQIDEAAAAAARDERVRERVMLAEAVGQPQLAEGDDFPALSRAVHDFVADAPSMLVVTQAEDLVGEEEGVNLPGTDRERPNWRRRLTLDADAIFDRADREGTLRKAAT